jgi:DNA-binding response OmpR family regulator
MSKILLIEDSKTLGSALKTAFEIKGYEVIWVSDGRDGFPAVKKNMPDVILLDLMLPHVSGYDICKAVKTDNATYLIPVIVMSTLTKPEQKERAIEAGADHFIDKPYDFKAALEQIYKYLPKK